MKEIFSLVRGFLNFLFILYQRRFLIVEMVKRDVATNYAGSILGFFWTFINPLIIIFILWLVVGVGFKAQPVGEVPFVIWLTAGMAIWNTFADAINGSTQVIVGNTHLVKKVLFPVSILPVVKLLTSFVSHFIFLLLLLALIIFYHLPFSPYWLQAFYYLAAMSILALGVSWLTSSINIFARDTRQIVAMILQIGFWATPIFWDARIMPEWIQSILKLNPMAYVVQGYRNSFIYFVPFWENWQMTLYFWSVTGLVFILGAIVFLRLRPHFADAL